MIAKPAFIWVAVAFAIGIAAGRYLGGVELWPWIAMMAAMSLLVPVLLKVDRRAFAYSAGLLAVCCFGSSWYIFKIERLPADHLSNLIGQQSSIVHLRGLVANEPTILSGTTGAMARFDYRPPATFFQMRIVGLRDVDDVLHSVSGNVLVRSAETLPPLNPGDLIELQGQLVPFFGPRNPGGFDRETYAKTLNQVGQVMVPNRELVQIVERHHPSAWIETITRWRTDLRNRASSWILDDLPPDSTQRRDALLAAILLGERDPELQSIGESFRRVGLSHILAISGMHLGILAGMVLLIFRFNGTERRWHGVALICIILLYLFLIEARMPVLRAAIMICAASIGMIVRRHIYIGGLVAMSAIGLLIWQPAQVFNAGFQLSFGVVLALIVFVPRLRRRWFGDEVASMPSTGGMLWERVKMLLVVSVVAWAIALPLVAYHFQIISPLAAIASVIALPIASVILAFGYAKLLASAFLPSVGILFGIPLAIFCDILLSIVNGVDAAPFATIEAPQPSILWTIAALCVSIGWLVLEMKWQKKAMVAATLGLAVWLWWPILPVVGDSPYLRIDMLAVGDGSCYVIRSDDSTVLFDAGSGNDLDVGRSTIVPALKALRIASLDAIVISHANLDHYAGILEVSDRFDVDRIIVTPQLLQRAADDPLGPMAFVLEKMTERITFIEEVSAGDTLKFGRATWTWLHPSGDDTFQHVNDESMVVKMMLDDSPVSILMTGDIQDDAIEMMLNDVDTALELRDVTIVELPHHGSFRDEAIQLLQFIDPEIVLQSTGRSRLEPDRWEELLSGSERLITARDGAASVIVNENGTIETRRFLED